MMRVYAILLTGLLAGLVAAQEGDKPVEPPKGGVQPEALEILKKVDEAAKKVEVVKYKVSSKSSGMLETRVPNVEGTAVLVGGGTGPNLGLGKFYIDAQLTLPGSSETKHYTMGSDGELTYLIDHAKKIAYEDMSPDVLGEARNTVFRSLAMLEFVHPTPFSDEINGDKAEITGSETIGGVECHIIDVVYKGGQGQSIWSFSKKDFLPRRRVHVVEDRQSKQKGTQTITLVDFEPDPKLDNVPFKLVLPEGFTKSDDFAP